MAYLAVVDDDLLPELDSSAHTHTPLSPAPPSARFIALSQAADVLLGRRELGEASSLEDALRGDDLAGVPHAHILEGIGAIVLDDDTVPADEIEARRIPGIHVVREGRAFAPALPALFSPDSVEPEPDTRHLRYIACRAEVSGTGANVLVGVLDSGLDPRAPSFANRRVPFAVFDEGGRRSGSRPVDLDPSGHGTYTCGLAAGPFGFAPDAGLAVAAVLTEPVRGPNAGISGGVCQFLAGLDWLITTPFRQGQRGVDVLCFAGGFRRSVPRLERAIGNAVRASSTLVIAAAGNEQRRDWVDQPAGLAPCLAVGSIDHSGAFSPSSNARCSRSGRTVQPDKPEVCAQGENVRSAAPPPSLVRNAAGTSCSTAIAASYAATLIQRTPALTENHEALKAAILRHPALPTPAICVRAAGLAPNLAAAEPRLAAS